MTRAEEAAVKAYPVKDIGNDMYGRWDVNDTPRNAYQQGYEQAEKDIKDALMEMFLYAQEAAGGDYQKAVYQMAIDKLNSL